MREVWGSISEFVSVGDFGQYVLWDGFGLFTDVLPLGIKCLSALMSVLVIRSVSCCIFSEGGHFLSSESVQLVKSFHWALLKLMKVFFLCDFLCF